MLLDCDDPAAVHKFCSMRPAFVFEARPVIPIEDAVRVELEAISFRDELSDTRRIRHITLMTTCHAPKLATDLRSKTEGAGCRCIGAGGFSACCRGTTGTDCSRNL